MEPRSKSPPPQDQNKEATRTLDRNVQILHHAREELDRRRTLQQRLGDAIAAFTGRMLFVYVHLVGLIGWIFINTGHTGLRIFDPYPFTLLANIASVEAIFLAGFVLMNQNRTISLAQKRAELDMHVSLLSEHEITRLVKISHEIAKKLGIDQRSLPDDIEEIKADTPPDLLIERISHADNQGLR